MDRVTGAAIPAVEGAHMRDAAHRAIAGFSMGGYGAMNIAMQDPGVFGQVVSIAGYFVVDDLSGMFGGSAASSPGTPRPRIPARRGDCRSCSRRPRPRAIRSAAARRPGWAACCARAACPATVRIQPGKHNWAYAMRALRQAFTFLTDNWRQGPPTDG